MNQLTTPGWSLERALRESRTAGFDAIGLWRPKLSDVSESHGIRLVQKSGMPVSSLSYVGGFTGAHDCTIDEAVFDAEEAIRMAAELGAGCVVATSGPRWGHTHSHARRLVVGALRHLGDFAARFAVTLALQPLPTSLSRWSFLHTLDEALDVVERSRRPRVQLALNVSLGENRGLIERIPHIVDRIALVQFDGSVCHEPHGPSPVAEVCRSLQGAGYDGCFEVAVVSEDVPADDYDTFVKDARVELAEVGF